MQLKNPISSELSQMRVGLWPGLLASMLYNAHRQQTAIKLFEVGTVFEGEGEALQEHPSIAGLLTGELGGLKIGRQRRAAADEFHVPQATYFNRLAVGLPITPINYRTKSRNALI